MKRQRPTVAITLDPEVHAAARALAAEQRLPFSRLVESLLRREVIARAKARSEVRVARDPALRPTGRRAAYCEVKRWLRAMQGGAQ